MTRIRLHLDGRWGFRSVVLVLLQVTFLGKYDGQGQGRRGWPFSCLPDLAADCCESSDYFFSTRLGQLCWDVVNSSLLPFLQWLYCRLHFFAKDGKVILCVCLGTVQSCDCIAQSRILSIGLIFPERSSIVIAFLYFVRDSQVFCEFMYPLISYPVFFFSFFFFHALFYVVVHFLVFLRCIRFESSYSSLLLSHRSRISAVTQGLFFWRCLPKASLAVSVTPELKVMIIESTSAFSLLYPTPHSVSIQEGGGILESLRPSVLVSLYLSLRP